MFGQGWAFGKPMPAAELAALVEKQRIKGLSFA
jgi:sensor c-di-GMP phosphodiesterase-like protein